MYLTDQIEHLENILKYMHPHTLAILKKTKVWGHLSSLDKCQVYHTTKRKYKKYLFTCLKFADL